MPVDTTNVYGSIVISATTPMKEFPQLINQNTTTGMHTTSKFRGRYDICVAGPCVVQDELVLPQRNKFLKTILVSKDINQDKLSLVNKALKISMTNLDSRFDASRHLYKLNIAMLEVYGNERAPFLAIINNIAEHSNFSLLSMGIDLQVLGIYDIVNKSVRLAWSTDPYFINDIKAVDFTRYVFYRFPTLYNRPLFIYTQTVCSKWLRWARDFKDEDGVLKTFNALENFLYKDPTRATLS